MKGWIPPTSLEERLRELFVPAPLYMRYRLGKELKMGEPELRLVPFLIDPSRDAIDVGANKGVWTYYLARYCRHVYAFEPNPKIYRWLVRYTRATDVTASNFALSDRTGTAELRIPRKRRGYSNQHSSLSPDNIADHYGSVSVETKRLDDLALDSVGFIKIDVEGHELAVLKGAQQTLHRCRPRLVVEMEERHTKRRIEDLIAEVEDYGYLGLALTPSGITSLKTLDLNKHHRSALGTRDYVNNFIFLPSR